MVGALARLAGGALPVTDREWHRHMARVLIAQARATLWPDWRAFLIEWALRHRRDGNRPPKQPSLF